MANGLNATALELLSREVSDIVAHLWFLYRVTWFSTAAREPQSPGQPGAPNNHHLGFCKGSCVRITHAFTVPQQTSNHQTTTNNEGQMGVKDPL